MNKKLIKRLNEQSREALLLWRQILDRPVQMPYWEVTSNPVKELLAAGLMQIVPADAANQQFIADLPWYFEDLRFTDNQRELLNLLAKGPLSTPEYLTWASEKGIQSRLDFINDLALLCGIKQERKDQDIFYTL